MKRPSNLKKPRPKRRLYFYCADVVAVQKASHAHSRPPTLRGMILSKADNLEAFAKEIRAPDTFLSFVEVHLPRRTTIKNFKKMVQEHEGAGDRVDQWLTDGAVGLLSFLRYI